MTIDSATQNRFNRPLTFNFFYRSIDFAYFSPETSCKWFKLFAFAASDRHGKKYVYHVLRSKNLAVASLTKGKTRSK